MKKNDETENAIYPNKYAHVQFIHALHGYFTDIGTITKLHCQGRNPQGYE